MLGKRGSANKKRKGPILIGLTGSFGTGKSTVADLFKRKGALVLSADQIAHEVFRKGNPLHQRVRSLFPELENRFDRDQVAAVVFKNSKRRQALETLTHPYVFGRIGDEIKKTKKRVIVLEIPLLFETGYDRQCDRTIVVKTKAEKVLKRLSLQGYRSAEVKARWRAQMPLREKIRRADFVVDNSEGFENTKREVETVWDTLNKNH